MRRTLLVALAVALISGMAVSTFAASGVTSITWPISISFGAYDIDLVSDSPDPLSYGIVAPDVDILSNNTGGQNRITLHNAGYATIDYTVAAACSNTDTGLSTTPWNLGATIGSNGADTAVLAAIFTAPVLASEQAAPYGRDIAVADFADNDVLGGTAVVASLTNLFEDTPVDQIWQSGYNVSTVPTGDTVRSLRFLLQTPTSLSAGTSVPVLLNVTVGAQLH